jgi:hypothetical protein
MEGWRWRTELDLNSSKSLDQDHRAAAKRAGPEWSRLAWCVRVGWHGMRRSGFSSRKQPFTKRNQRTAAAAGEETEVPDADEAAR